MKLGLAQFLTAICLMTAIGGASVGQPLTSSDEKMGSADETSRSKEAVSREKTGPMGIADARHFLARTGFGGTLAEMEATAQLSRLAAVAALLANVHQESLLPAPEFVLTPRSSRTLPRDATRDQRMMFQKERRLEGQNLKSWWVAEMALTDSPFTERLTLFWHNHFVSELRKVRDPELMWRQNELFRRHAAGSFRALLREVSTDAAMVIYLDSQQNRRRAPNENFARELYELFTLGEGHYTETDIKETARALTGWRVARIPGTVSFVSRQHDPGEKTIFGETGLHDVDDVIRIVLERPRVAEHIVESLWREFVSPDLVAGETQRLAAVFRDADYRLAPLYKALLESPAFWVDTNRGALFRSPVDLVVGTARVLGLFDVPPQSLSRAMVGMGQNLLDPPNVKGWPGGERWITSDALLTRHQFLERAMLGLAANRGRDRSMAGGEDDPSMGGMADGADRRARRRRRNNPPPAAMNMRSEWIALGDSNPERAAALATRLCPLPPVIEPKPGEFPADTLSRLLLDPTYQLK